MRHHLPQRYRGPGIVSIAAPLLLSAALVLATLYAPLIPSPAEAYQLPFYDHLSPYRNWAEVATYGWGCLPPIVETEWRPYAAGHREHTEYDWTWSSRHPRVLTEKPRLAPQPKQGRSWDGAERRMRRGARLAGSRSISRHIRSRSMQLPDDNKSMRRRRKSRGLPGRSWGKGEKPTHGWIRYDRSRRNILHPQPRQRLHRREPAHKNTHGSNASILGSRGAALRSVLRMPRAGQSSGADPSRVGRAAACCSP